LQQNRFPAKTILLPHKGENDNGPTAITIIISWLVGLVINLCILAPIFGFIGAR
jgi:hypothetical protein